MNCSTCYFLLPCHNKEIHHLNILYMKKIKLLTILLCLVICSQAQNKELSVTYSPLSIYRLEKLSDGDIDGQTKYFVLGAVNLEYNRYVNDWLKLGVNIMYDKAVVEGLSSYYGYYALFPQEQTSHAYRATKSGLVIAPQIDFEYLRNPKFKLYSGLNIGYAYERVRSEGVLSGSSKIDGVTFHINLLGFRWGQKQGFTGNIGAGYKGFINLGYFIRF